MTRQLQIAAYQSQCSLIFLYLKQCSLPSSLCDWLLCVKIKQRYLNMSYYGCPPLVTKAIYDHKTHGEGGIVIGVPEQGICLTWEDLCVTVSSGKKDGSKVILDGLMGYAKPGELLAIMGPSGCGKTTLLDALAGNQYSYHSPFCILHDAYVYICWDLDLVQMEMCAVMRP